LKLKDFNWKAGFFLKTILINWKVKDLDVKEVIRKVSALKVLKLDRIPNSLLKTYNKDKRLLAILTKII